MTRAQFEAVIMQISDEAIEEMYLDMDAERLLEAALGAQKKTKPRTHNPIGRK